MKSIIPNLSLPILSLIIICKNNYLNIGMMHLINNLQPMIFHKTGKLCDIKTFNTLTELDISTLSETTEHCLVIERDAFPAFNAMLVESKSLVKFNNVFFLSTTGTCSSSQKNFLPCKPDLNYIKRTLYKIMTTDYGASLESLKNHTRNLTPGDKELLRLIVAENNVTEIAKKLNLTPQAVYANRSRLYTKLGVSNIHELLSTGAILGL